jgi:hypothetical protein
MRKLLLLAGAAALGLAMPAAAKKGGDHGHGQDDKGRAAHAERGHGGDKHAKGGGRDDGRASKPHHAERRAAHGGKPDKGVRHASRRHGRLEGRRDDDRRAFRDDDRRDFRDDGRRGFGDDGRRFADLAAGCPPGLAKKHNGCLPPGQAKKIYRLGDHVRRNAFAGYVLPAEYRALYYDTPDTYYRYQDGGYIYRVDAGSGLVTGMIPLLGGGFAVGQPLPLGYDVYNLPLQYRDVWQDSDEYSYRYGDDAIYRVDSGTGIIESIVALLAGDLNVGEALPAGYDAYNLPLDYRDEYADSDDYLYRYADGNIYQVDAQTQIVQAIVEMLA